MNLQDLTDCEEQEKHAHRPGAAPEWHLGTFP